MSDEDLDDRLVADLANDVIHGFEDGVSSFFSAEERRFGFYESQTREGVATLIPLLTVSVAVIVLLKDADPLSQEDIARLMVQLKKEAKMARDKIALYHISSGLNSLPVARS